MKEIKYNRVGNYEFPELKQERPLPTLSRFWKRISKDIKRKTSRTLPSLTSKR